MLLFDDKFLQSLPDDRYAALLMICQHSREWLEELDTREGLADIDTAKAVELLAALTEMQSRLPDVEYKLPAPEVPGRELIRALIPIVDLLHRRAQAEMQKHGFAQVRRALSAMLPKGYALEFTDGDIQRIQDLINELRDHISKSRDFAEDHKQRLLRRLERLQGEVHKRMSDADRIFGLIGDAGVAIGKFGKNAKPIVDRIRELAEIAWKAQARAEQLASDAPFPQLQDKKQVSE
jgi:hypothetical protein